MFMENDGFEKPTTWILGTPIFGQTNTLFTQYLTLWLSLGSK
jgi:hypothetical protein